MLFILLKKIIPSLLKLKNSTCCDPYILPMLEKMIEFMFTYFLDRGKTHKRFGREKGLCSVVADNIESWKEMLTESWKDNSWNLHVMMMHKTNDMHETKRMKKKNMYWVLRKKKVMYCVRDLKKRNIITWSLSIKKARVKLYQEA